MATNITVTTGSGSATVEVSTGARGPAGSDASVTNSNVNAAISTDASATRTALGLGNVNNTSDANKPISTATQTALDSKISYNPASVVVVASAGTDTARGTALVDAYTAAKLLTPNGAALSSTNRATVVIPPGKYKVADTFTLDANFVDLAALVPSPPSRRLSTDNDADPNNGVLDTTSFRPQPTLIYTEAQFTNTVEQTANDVRLSGFSIAQLGSLDGFTDLGVPEWGAFFVGDCDNSKSLYTDMYFWCGGVAYAVAGGVRAWESLSGTWKNCIANGASFRVGYGNQVDPTSEFTARMFDCEAGPYSFIGDVFTGRLAYFAAKNCRLERCSVIGTVYGGESGGSGFAGCTAIGLPIESTAWFVDCVAGDLSFGLGVTNAGNYIRCRGGANSFGSTSDASADSNFSGYAEDCVGGNGSFGGSTVTGYGKLTGTLLRCKVEGNSKALRCQGAMIRDSRVTATTTGIHALQILDSNCTFINSDILVLQGGTGIPVYAATALSASVQSCRMNNGANDADGLSANVTNSCAVPFNTIDGTALATTGVPVAYNGALGTPSSGTLTNTTGLPISTGVSGLGTSVASSLAQAINTSSGFVTQSGGDTRYPQRTIAVSTAQIDSTSSTTPVDVTGLTGIQLEANTVYEYVLYSVITSGASGGFWASLIFSQNLAYTSTGFVSGGFTGTTGGGAQRAPFQDSATAIRIMFATEARTSYPIVAFGIFKTGSVAPTAKLQFSQNASNGTTSSIATGANLAFRKIY